MRTKEKIKKGCFTLLKKYNCAILCGSQNERGDVFLCSECKKELEKIDKKEKIMTFHHKDFNNKNDHPENLMKIDLWRHRAIHYLVKFQNHKGREYMDFECAICKKHCNEYLCDKCKKEVEKYSKILKNKKSYL